MLRQPAVAGYFYPADRKQLEEQLSSFLPERQRQHAVAVVVPHAGYMYSGHVAGAVYASVELPDTFILLCPNHTGAGSDFDLWPQGEWLTPLGSAQIDQGLSQQLLQLFPRARADGRAHMREHALEVQIPFLQFVKGQFRFVALCVHQLRFEFLEELGHALAEIVRGAGREILLIASSDMTHYESQESANRKDRLAIEQMEKLDARGLYDTIHRHEISMCGYLPATAVLLAANELGAARGTLVDYATSGDVTRDYSRVVGYAGIVIA